MKSIQLSLSITEDLTLKGVTISYNDTGLESNSELIKILGAAIVRAIDLNSDECEIQDMLNNNNIKNTIGK